MAAEALTHCQDCEEVYESKVSLNGANVTTAILASLDNIQHIRSILNLKY